jgi:membrane-bound lytic murein transglycosylase D
MKILVIFLFSLFLKADVINNSNLDVLYALDIEDSFILNKDLQEVYKDYSSKKKRYFIEVLEDGYNILPIIRNAINKAKIPKELISVAMAESFLTLNAKSSKMAKGLWQFMPETAKRFNLKIDKYVDERLDPNKSTEAAINYLKFLHNFFGKWYLAILAYNAGEARVVEAVVRAKVDKLCKSLKNQCKKNPSIKEYRKIIKNYQLHKKNSYIKLYKLYQLLESIPLKLEDLLVFQKGLDRQYLPKETRNYIIKILAMSFLFNNDDFIEYSNSYILNSGITSQYKKVDVPPGTSLYYIAKLLKMNYQTLKEHNLHLKYSFTPPYKYYIYIPYEKVGFFKKNFKGTKKFFYVYKVKKGDNIFKIAKTFGINAKIIKDYNKLGKYLKIGQKILIPMKSRIIKYKVKNGDTLYALSKKFGVSYKKIIKINNLKNHYIRVGQILKIPQRL